MKKSCGSCVNCYKMREDDWICENVWGQSGMPLGCTPPNDGACKNWTDDPKEKDKALKILHKLGW